MAEIAAGAKRRESVILSVEENQVKATPELIIDRPDVQLWRGDYRDVLPLLAPVNLVLTDPPYGITENEWDTALNFSEWWPAIWPLCSGPVVMTASQPFTSDAVSSQRQHFKHEWIWRKNRGSNFANTVREPMKEHESVVVFARDKWTYNPQRQERNGSGADRAQYEVGWNPGGSNYREFAPRDPSMITADRVPSSVQNFNTEVGLHPTQKPLKLMAYIISTYSNPGDTVLDPFAGSGTTLRAAVDLGRKVIGIEIGGDYCSGIKKRLSQTVLNFGDAC